MRTYFLMLAFIFGVSANAHAEGFLWSPVQTPLITCDFCGYLYPSGSCHSGIDFRARSSVPVSAAADGVVEDAIESWPDQYDAKAGYGNKVIIRHANGFWTIYGHLAKDTILVAPGVEVFAGQKIAMSDNSGNSKGAHLHFEVRDPQGRKVDPYGDPTDQKGCLPDVPSIAQTCGSDPLWATCPPTPYTPTEPPQKTDADGDGYFSLASGGNDCDDKNKNIHPDAQDTTCDNKDNDCNGIKDDLFQSTNPNIKAPAAALGKPCTVGKGECARTGTMVCTADGRATVCSADADPVFAEVCDGKDNNCDGRVDENADADCQDKLVCNGEERCVQGKCVPGPTFDCSQYDGLCAVAVCTEEWDLDPCEGTAPRNNGVSCDDENECTSQSVCTDGHCRGKLDLDQDKDGYFAVFCGGEDCFCGGNDCDDSDPEVNPGAMEVAGNGRDENCDGVSDVDEDGDGYFSPASGGNDCDDFDADINPGVSDLVEMTAEGSGAEMDSDIGDLIGFTSEIAVDPDGYPYVVYGCEGNAPSCLARFDGGIHYMEKSASGWGPTMFIDGFKPHILADSAGDIHIFYFKYGDCIGHLQRVGGAWPYEDVFCDANGFADHREVFDFAGNLHIVYRDSSTKELKYTNNTSGAWLAPVVVDDGMKAWGSGPSPFIVVRSDGSVHIAFDRDDAPASRLHYFSQVGGVWTTEDVVSGSVRWIDVDGSDTLHLFYRENFFPNASKYLQKQQGSEEWMEYMIPTQTVAPFRVVDSGVVYAGGSGTRAISTNFSGTWEEGGFQPSYGLRSLTVDSAGKVHILYAFRESIPPSLHYARYSVTNDVDENCDGR